MINVINYQDLGRANHGWLDARHHFSFASYYNPERMGFGALRVINDDVIKAGGGFDTHPHQNMEIITYVRKGAITHRDSKGNVGRTTAGDVQVMSAGTGIYHSEFNLESEDTNLYQIWIEPNKQGVEPRWDARQFPGDSGDDGLKLLVSNNDAAPLQIHQDASIYAGQIKAGRRLSHSIEQQAYVLLSEGEIEINGERLSKGDGAEITELSSIDIVAIQTSDVLLLDVPKQARH